jgi:hypothetical protein
VVRITHKSRKSISKSQGSDGNCGDLIERDIAEGIDALNYCLVELGCEPQLRAFIDAVFGASSKYALGEEFELSDADLAARAVPAKYGEESFNDLRKRIENGKKWTQLWRKRLIKWQQDMGLTIFICKEGYGYSEADGYKGMPSRYCNLIRSLPAEVLSIARSSSLWESRPDEAKRLAAKQVIAQYPREIFQPKLRRILLPQKELERNLSTIRTKMVRNLELLDDPTIIVTDDVNKLVQDVKTLLCKLDALLPLTSRSFEPSPFISNHPEDKNLLVQTSEDKVATLSLTTTSSLISNGVEKVGEGGEDKKLPVQNVTSTELVDEAFLNRLQNIPFRHLDVCAVYNKFQIHCELKGREPTKEYFFNFLKRERIDSSPLTTAPFKRYLTQLYVGSHQPNSLSETGNIDLQGVEAEAKQESTHSQDTKSELQVSERRHAPEVTELVEHANTKADISMSEESFNGAQWILKDWSLDACKKVIDELCTSGVRGLEPSIFWRKVYQVNGAREMASRVHEQRQES